MTRFKDVLYEYFVHRDERIKHEYERYVTEHIEEHKSHRIRHILLLAKLNWHYSIKKNHSPLIYCEDYLNSNTVKPESVQLFDNAYLEKYWEKPMVRMPKNSNSKVFPESEYSKRESADELIGKLSQYDVICFDVFDTLLFRIVSDPADVFYLMELKYHYPGFKQLRKKALSNARERTGIHDVTLDDIYVEISRFFPNMTPQKELEMEKDVTYANPYLLDVVNSLTSLGKTVVCVSDMYLDGSRIRELLKTAGFPELQVFSSCDYRANKTSGELQSIVSKTFWRKSIVFVGNDFDSDFLKSIDTGMSAYWYQSCKSLGISYRSKADKSIEGSIYNAIINNAIHCGSFVSQGSFYEHGYIYGGIIAYGFCSFIEKLNDQYHFDKLLFLSRDMDVFYKVYNSYFGSVESEYVVFSRFSSQQLVFDIMPGEYLEYTIKTRINKNTISEVLSMYDLPCFLDELSNFGLTGSEKLDAETYMVVESIIYSNKDRVSQCFRPAVESARNYYKQILGNAKRICILDLGWKGTAVNYLSKLFDMWKFDVSCHGAIVSVSGNAYAKSVMDSKLLSVYMRREDIDFKVGVPNGSNYEAFRGHMFEATFSSTEDSLLEYFGKDNEFVYGRKNPNTRIIESMQHGILDFSEEFSYRIRPIVELLNVNGFTANTPINKALKTKSYTIPTWGFVVDEATSEPGFYKDSKFKTFFQYMKSAKLVTDSDLANEIEYSPEGRILFICSTYNHIIVTLAHVYLDQLHDVDIILYDDLPNCYELRFRLSQLSLFNNIVIFVKTGLPQRVFSEDGDIQHLKENHYKHLVAVEKRLNIDLTKYEELYTFYDGHHLGLYIQEKHLNYNLIEDGINHFQHIYATPSVQEMPTISEYTKRGYLDGWMYLCCGQNPNCLSIEVNENKGLAIDHPNIIERPRRKMLDELSSEQKKSIFSVFMDDFDCLHRLRNQLAIVFTSVLANDGWVDSEATQIKIYRDIVAKLQNEGFFVVLKPHPRDKVIYNKLFRDCYILDKDFPSELLDFDTRLHFEKGVVIASSAMELIECIENKVKLGFRYFENYRQHVAPWILESLNHPERYNW